MVIRQKILTPPLALRLSGSLKVTGTDTDRSATYDFVLVIYSKHVEWDVKLLVYDTIPIINMGLSRTVSEIKATFAKFSHPVYN